MAQAHGSWLMAHGSWLMALMADEFIAHGSQLMAHGAEPLTLMACSLPVAPPCSVA
jgi:hypothetical protein